jgi:hypothetical protein
MKPFASLLAIAVAVVFGLTSCEKPHAKFRPGDKVTFKKSDHSKKGVVYLRFNTDEPYYYVRFPGPPDDTNVLDGPGDDSWKDGVRSHMEGPFGDEDLELAQR